MRSGVKTKVLLLSATPVNNDLRDLRNQLLFLTAGDDAGFQQALGIASLETTLGTAQRVFNSWAQEQRHNPHALMERLDGELFTLLDALTIARSRKHLQTYYADTVAALGGFPTRAKPSSLAPPLDLNLRPLRRPDTERGRDAHLPHALGAGGGGDHRQLPAPDGHAVDAGPGRGAT